MTEIIFFRPKIKIISRCDIWSCFKRRRASVRWRCQNVAVRVIGIMRFESACLDSRQVDAPRYWLFRKIHTPRDKRRAYTSSFSFPRTIFSNLLSIYPFASLPRCGDRNGRRGEGRGEMHSVTRVLSARPWGYSFRIPGHLVLPCLRNRWTSRRACRY